MRKLFVIAFAFFVGFLNAQAQGTASLGDGNARWSIGVKAGGNYFRVKPAASSFGKGIGWMAPGIFIDYNATPYFGVGLDAGYFRYDRNDNKGQTIDVLAMGSVNLSNLLSPMRSGGWEKTNLYAKAGIGAGFYSYQLASMRDFTDTKYTAIGATGLSFEYEVAKSVSLLLEGQYRYYTKQNMGGVSSPNKDGNDAIALNIGLRWKIEGGQKTHTHNMLPADYYDYFNNVMVVEQEDIEIEIDPEIYNRLTSLEEETEVLKKEVAKLRDNFEQMEYDLKQLEDKTDGVVMSTFQNIEFEFASFVLTPESERILDRIIAILKNSSNWNRVNISGHTDNVGEANLNQKISEYRAKAVKEYMAAHGIDSSKMTATGYGEEKPIASNDTADGRRKNRRVEFEIIK